MSRPAPRCAARRLAPALAFLALVGATPAAAQTCPSATPLQNYVPVTTNADISIYSVTPTLGRWGGVAVRALDGEDWNLEARDATAPYPTCFTGLLANSSTLQVDFLVADWHHRALGTDYVAVGTGAGVGTSALVDYQEFDGELVSNRPFSFIPTGPGDVVDVFEAQMFTGIPYEIRVAPAAGVNALRVFVFAPITGGTGWAPRGGNAAELALVGGSENVLPYTATADGYHGIVVVNGDGAAGGYHVTISRCPFSSYGLTDGQPYFLSVLDDWPAITAPTASWGVAGVRGEPGYSYNLDVAPSLRSQYGLLPACTDSVLAAQYSGLGTRLVTGDFRSLPLRLYTVHARLEGSLRTNSEGWIEWEDGADTLVVNGDAPLVSPPAHNVLDAWSVRLVAGATYDWLLDPAPGATAAYSLLLFRNPSPGTGYWASRPDAVFTTGGAGQFVPSATDVYGAVVVNDNGGTGGYSLSVTSPQIGVEPGLPRALASRIRLAAPNPTRGGVRFEYEVAAAGRVALEVHDLAGRAVAHVPLGERPAGPGEFSWDGIAGGRERLPAGLYLVGLSLEGRTVDRVRITVLR